MKNIIINTDNERLFLITFNNKSTNNNIICNAEGMGEALRTYNKTIVKSIKVLNREKAKFERLSKETLNNFTSWNTDTNLTLEKLNLI